MTQTKAHGLPDPMPEAVRAVFDAAPGPLRDGMLALRARIADVAARTPEAGRLEEALRWGQPAYLTPETRSGSTLRIGCPKAGGVALYVNCQTTLMEDWRAIHGEGASVEGARAVLFARREEVDAAPLEPLIRAALTYHCR